MGKAKLNIPMCAALVLLLLTMVSIHLTSGLYARYTTTSSGSDSARVAKFDVVGEFGEDITLDCSKNETSGAYEITVKNNSEVAIKYVLYVTLRSKDSGLEVQGTDFEGTMTDIDYKGNGETGTRTEYPNQFGFAGELMFTRNTPLAPGAMREHILNIKIPKVTSMTQKVTDQEELNWELEVLVEIDVTQVD